MLPLREEMSALRKSLEAAPERLGLSVSELAPWVFVLAPATASDVVDGPFALCAFAGVHGDEIGGVYALRAFVEALTAGTLKSSIVIALGNLDALAAGQRYVDRDLNRSFAMTDTSATGAIARARVLSPFLERSRFFVDLHQTQQPSDRSFFIFPYDAASFAFARRLAPWQTLVTHWGRPFSPEGACSDEYAQRFGCAALTVELGQRGAQGYQAQLGAALLLRAVALTQEDLGDTAEPTGELMTFVALTEHDRSLEVLAPGFHNFAAIEEGQALGSRGDEEVASESTGRILFPKYSSENKGGALFHLLRRFELDELPET